MDPVITPVGHTYERGAIMRWLETYSTCPVSRLPLTADQLIPNLALRPDHAPVVAAVPAPVVPLTSYSPENGVVVVPATGVRVPVLVLAVIDVSASMATRAVIKEMNVRSTTVLDIVKHAAKTVAAMLSENDLFGVIAYSHESRVVLAPTPMHSAGCGLAHSAISSLRPGGGTHIFSGLSTAMNLVQEHGDGKVNHVLLLTDGVTNLSTERTDQAGLVPKYTSAIEEFRQGSCPPFAIHTFGFGYQDMDGLLMKSVATVGGGVFSYIPDSSFVGTAFVNAVSMIKLTYAVGALLVCDGVALEAEACSSARGRVVLPPLRVDAPTCVLLKPPLPSGAALTLSHGVLGTFGVGVAEGTGTGIAGSYVKALTAVRYVLSARGCFQRFDEVSMGQMMAQAIVNGQDEPILEDLMGQVSIALSNREWFSKWGSHYILSLMRSHALRFCANFKDVGLKAYATPEFESLRTEGDQIYLAIEPPTQEVVSSGGMGTFHNSNNPCFSEGDVALEDGTFKSVLDVRMGDRLRASGKVVTVRCVVTTVVSGGSMPLCTLDQGVVVTPWHPVSTDGGATWTFPENLKSQEPTAAGKVVSLVLEEPDAFGFDIGPYLAISLGHSLDMPVAKHPYFGSSRVVDDLRRREGWEEGFIVLKAGSLIRDPDTGLFDGLVPPS
jgi:hypothetical protein